MDDHHLSNITKLGGKKNTIPAGDNQPFKKMAIYIAAKHPN
jgi:hypothetical protein